MVWAMIVLAALAVSVVFWIANNYSLWEMEIVPFITGVAMALVLTCLICFVVDEQTFSANGKTLMEAVRNSADYILEALKELKRFTNFTVCIVEGMEGLSENII